jgi:hypothetical protein
MTQHDIPLAAGTPVAFGIILRKLDRQRDASIGIPLAHPENIGERRYGWQTALGENGTDVVVQSVTDNMQINIWPVAELQELFETSPEFLAIQEFACSRQAESSESGNFPTEALLRGDRTGTVVVNEPITHGAAEVPKERIADVLHRHRTVEIQKHLQSHQLPRRDSS